MTASISVTATDTANPELPEGRMARLGLAFAQWSERWFPDPLVFALLAVIVVFVLAVLAGEPADVVATQGGKAFWLLIPFTMQMVMVVIGGFVVASAPVVRRGISRIAALPQTARGAVAFIAAFAMLTSLLSWGLSLVFGGQLVRDIARRMPNLDYRAAGAASYLGLGVTWALGLSSSAAMMMATPSSLPPAVAAISGVIPLTETLFLWQNYVLIAVLIVVATWLAYVSVPSQARTAADMGISLDDELPNLPIATKPGEKLEHNPLLTLLVCLLLLFYLFNEFRTSPKGALAVLDLNTYNLLFITIGLLLHWRPISFLRAVYQSVPATAGVLIQFPFYAMIFGMIVNTGLSESISQFFVKVSSPDSYALLVAAYSSTLGVFIPSGGSKWIIEAPYVLEAAKVNQVHLGWVVQIYNAAEALPNLVNPFFMLPLLGILKCKARDLVGYGMLQLLVLLPLAYALCWFLATTLTP